MNMFIFKWKRTDFRKKVNTVLSFFAQFMKNNVTYCNKNEIFIQKMFFLKTFLGKGEKEEKALPFFS